MICEYFDICGSCNLGGKSYDEQLNIKIIKEKERFKLFWNNDFDIIKSSDGAFRNRAEFRIWKTYNKDETIDFNYAMNDINKKILPITSCSIVNKTIANLMPTLIQSISINSILNHKLFTCEFLY